MISQRQRSITFFGLRIDPWRNEAMTHMEITDNYLETAKDNIQKSQAQNNCASLINEHVQFIRPSLAWLESIHQKYLNDASYRWLRV